ncbi:Nif3-like dinuclear metal center hexameric protein [Gorillibacterium sp. CAU 1737]|uniref:Nif3-like dinuclear metal center hexameric protein n=1 Tax=Gorillibacterium sp. CAU 1737 TaxID=3140362 RepID=UPI00326044A0
MNKPNSYSIGDLLPQIIGEHPEGAVDRLLCGRHETRVTAIATAFVASMSVLHQAAQLGVNLLITHEGLYYSHHEGEEWGRTSLPAKEKARWIEENGMGIVRLHDRVHRQFPDLIMEGLLRELEWEYAVLERQATYAIVELPDWTLIEVSDQVKRKLGLSYLRAAGPSSLRCRRVGLLVGYRGSGAQTIPLWEQANVDLIIAGEGPEWEAPEYARDAVRLGLNKGLILLGHAESESPGMRLLADQMAVRLPGLPVHYLADSPVFRIL